MNRGLNFDNLRNLAVGTVEFVSPIEIKILLDINAPQNTSINTGVPTLFPKINGFVLIPNESGALVGIISWMGIEYSQYPKRKGLKDFDIIDLPYPLRRISVNPLGTLKINGNDYELERGVFSFPSVGDTVLMPRQEQLQAIIENKEAGAKVQIGTSPLAANTPIKIDPNKLFGRHLAILGNTGSGKSCSVAGVIRWSLEAALEEQKKLRGQDSNIPDYLNARFIILDPNGEYSKTFNDLKPKKFKVKLDESEADFDQLRVPAWMWNSYEWSAVTQASGKTQRPLLRQALREVKNGSIDCIDDPKLHLRRFYSSCLVEVKKDLLQGASAYKGAGKTSFGKKIRSISRDAEDDNQKLCVEELKAELKKLADELTKIADSKYNPFQKDNKLVEAYNDFEKAQVEEAIFAINNFLKCCGGFERYKGPDEDSPVNFIGNDLPNHLERLAQEQNAQQYLDFLVMRVRTMLSDSRMASVIGTEPCVNLTDWLNDYIGDNNPESANITIVDLSLVPMDVIHLVVAVISRIVFEALQRYRKLNKVELPTVIVMEEAHTFIRKFNDNSDEISPQKMCCQTFERIAREGRKFGLGLLLSSQRPSELSATVLSQCNTFLLHRIVNDKDQELIKKLIPDNLGSLLSELSVLPTRKAILLGWASPLPVLLEMSNLDKMKRPNSEDPKFWDVWTGIEKRDINWQCVVKDWQNEGANNDKEEGQ